MIIFTLEYKILCVFLFEQIFGFRKPKITVCLYLNKYLYILSVFIVQWKSARFVNFRPRGPRLETRHGFIFLDARVFTSHTKVWRKLPTYGHVNQPSRNLDSEKLYATFLLLYEEERSLGNWSYDVIRVRVMSYNLLRYSTHTILATWGGILRVIKPTAENQQRWLKSNASGQEMGEQEARERGL